MQIMQEVEELTFTKSDPCWFCGKKVDMGYCCNEFDFVAYHKECGDKVSVDSCAVCVGEGLPPCCTNSIEELVDVVNANLPEPTKLPRMYPTIIREFDDHEEVFG